MSGQRAVSALRTQFPALPGLARRRIVGRARGNPLALIALAAAVAVDNGAEVLGSSHHLVDRRGVQALFESQLSELPASTRRQLLVAALNGGFDAEVLMAVKHERQGDLLELGPAERAGLIETSYGGSGWRFCHPLIAAAVTELATLNEKEAVRRQLSRETSQDESDQLATRVAEVTVDPDQMVVQLLSSTRDRDMRTGTALRSATATAARVSNADGDIDTAHRALQPWTRRASGEPRATGAARDWAAYGGGLSSLTPQEREVAELAATGQTNKQIGAHLYLSHRTVAAHLYRIFPKLSITSRAALRDALTA